MVYRRSGAQSIDRLRDVDDRGVLGGGTSRYDRVNLQRVLVARFAPGALECESPRSIPRVFVLGEFDVCSRVASIGSEPAATGLWLPIDTLSLTSRCRATRWAICQTLVLTQPVLVVGELN